MKKNILQNKKGFTIVEVLVALAIFSLSVLAMIVTLSAGTKSTDYVKNNLTATYLAQEGIEYARNVRDDYMLFTTGNNWSNFTSMLNTNNCYNNSDCGIDYGAATPTGGFNIRPCGIISGGCDLYLHSNGSYGNMFGGEVDPPSFNRVLHFNITSADEVTVTSIVTWDEGTQHKSINFTEYLYNWYPNISA